jgi:hypothetical protein
MRKLIPEKMAVVQKMNVVVDKQLILRPFEKTSVIQVVSHTLTIGGKQYE